MNKLYIFFLCLPMACMTSCTSSKHQSQLAAVTQAETNSIINQTSETTGLAEAPAAPETLETPETLEIPETPSDYIPWGFDEKSYQLYQRGIFAEFIPQNSVIDKCIMADLDKDGMDDVLMAYFKPDFSSLDDLNYEALNTVILKGSGQDVYNIATENENINYFSHYDGTAGITAGDGWFKLSRGRGTGSGYVNSYYFQYDENKKDWFFTAYYNNSRGYIEQGISRIQTPVNFGVISFRDFTYPENYWEFESNETKDLSLTEDGFKVTVNINNCYVMLQDKEKESRVNNLIADDVKAMIHNLQNLNVDINISISGSILYENPDIICIEYGFSGTIGDENVDDIGIEYATTMIDINQEKRIKLEDIIDTDKLYEIIMSAGFCEANMWDNHAAKQKFIEMPEEHCKSLLNSSDDIQDLFGNKKERVFCSVYEKSLCLYIQPEYDGPDEAPVESEHNYKLYITLDDILPDIKINYWNNPEEYVTHIVWMG